MDLRRHSLWLVGLGLLAPHAAYLLSAAAGDVPWCLPYLDGCTSISRAARHGDANLLFKLLMLPHAALLAAWWWRLAPALGLRASPFRPLGLAGAGFLALYVVFLGVEGPTYQWLRRYGITCYFALTVLAQMLAVRSLGQAPMDAPMGTPLRRALLAGPALLLALGLLSLPLQYGAADRDAAVNRLEWIYALLMQPFFPLAAAALTARNRPP